MHVGEIYLLEGKNHEQMRKMSMAARQRNILSNPEAWVLTANGGARGGYEVGQGVLEERHGGVIHPQGVQGVDEGRERVTV